MTKYKINNLRGFLNITGAISDETRIRILMILDIHELCVCQITETLELAPSTISKHLSILENADLISRRKVGRWVFYKLNEAKTFTPVIDALKLVKGSASQSQNIILDRKKIKSLLKEDINTICKRLYHNEDDYSKSRGRRSGRLAKA
jgi:ArsR family transcriptional regulator, arsenate/arsenite/antimonite-responsive transcriptional repressor